MRIFGWLAGLVLVLTVSGPASAQFFLWPFSSWFNSKPISTVNPNAPIAAPMYNPDYAGTTSFTGLFRNVGDISNTTVHPVSHFPTQAQLPGLNYLSAFQFRRGSP